MEENKEHKKGLIRGIYEDKYRKLVFVPLVILLLAFAQILFQYGSTGDFVNRGVELKGGIILTVERSYDAPELQSFLKQRLGGDILVSSMNYGEDLSIQVSDSSEDEILAAVEEKLGKLGSGDYTINTMSPALGSSFFSEIVKAVIISFLLMSLVVLLAFRAPTPVFAVILCAFSDIIVTIAIFNLTGIRLGKGGIAAFLMLIGYSVDSDILLTTKMLKKSGHLMDRLYSAMRTGMTMTFTTIAAVLTALLFTQSEIIRQIMIILLIGLFVDLVFTWLQNAGILRIYLERKHHGQA